jgi:hypothetical protein
MSFFGHNISNSISDFIFGDRSAERAAAAQQSRIHAVPVPQALPPTINVHSQAAAAAPAIHMPPPHHSHLASAAAHPPVPTSTVCSNVQCRRILTPVDRFCSVCGAQALVTVLVPSGAGHAVPAAHFQGPHQHHHHHHGHHHHYQAPIVYHQASAPVQHYPSHAGHQSAAMPSPHVYHQHQHPQPQHHWQSAAASPAAPLHFEPGDPTHQHRNQHASAPGEWADVSKNAK